MKSNKIAVFGDSILDSYTYYLSNRLSPEAPVPVIEHEKKEYFPGGAALTAYKLATYINNVDLYTQIGADSLGKILREKLINVNILNFAATNYSTILKNRIIVNNKYYLREDSEIYLEHNKNNKIIKKFKENITNYKAVLFIDYKKGYFNEKLFNELKNLCIQKNIKIFLDPHVDNVFNFSGIDYIKPNLLESKKITGKNNIRSALRALESKYNTTPIITLGANGSVTIIDSKVVYSKIYKTKFMDSSGCGDIFFAAFVDSIIKNKTLIDSLNTGVKKASESCEFFGYIKN